MIRVSVVSFVFVGVCVGLMASANALIDVADKDVTVNVIVPTQIPLTVEAGKSFREAASDFADKNSLDRAVSL